MSADLSMWSSEAWSSAADVYLLARSREGSAEAFGELWRRHLSAAYAVAGRYRGRAAAEDIVAEASARVFALLQEGRGPDEHFRSYFLSAVRTVAIDNSRRDLRLVPTEDESLERLSEPVSDDFAAELGSGEFDPDLIRTAFRGLSERDQRVLWHTTVEGEAPRTLAPVLGMTANAVSARAMRAREALRAQYLDACAQRGVPGADSDECRWALAHLGAHVRGRLPKRQKARVEQHLEECSHAAAVAADLRAIHAEFPALIVPLVFLAGVSTPGFVSIPALAGLVGAGGAGAGALATTAGAVGTAGTAGTAGVAGTVGGAGSAIGTAGSTVGTAVGSAGAGAVAVGAGGAAAGGSAAGGAAASGGAAGGATAGGGIGDAMSQFTGRASNVVAGVVIGLGLAATGQVPAAAPLTERPPATAAPSPTTTAAPAPVPPAATTPPVVPPPATTDPPALKSVTPTPKRVVPPAVQRTLRPTIAPPTSTAVISVKVINYSQGATRFLVQVSGITSESQIVIDGSRALTMRNGSWACTMSALTVLSCTGQGGQVQLEQAGGPAPVRVTVIEASGASRTRVFGLADGPAATAPATPHPTLKSPTAATSPVTSTTAPRHSREPRRAKLGTHPGRGHRVK